VLDGFFRTAIDDNSQLQFENLRKIHQTKSRTLQPILVAYEKKLLHSVCILYSPSFTRLIANTNQYSPYAIRVWAHAAQQQ